MGRPGHKGSTGLKGKKGNRGSIGVQGPKGECVIFPKIILFPESLDVFLNKRATFYCWVQGATSKKITWCKLGGTLFSNTLTPGGVLHIRNVTRAHAGSYMCTAYTSYGILKPFASLALKGKISYFYFFFARKNVKQSFVFCRFVLSILD